MLKINHLVNRLELTNENTVSLELGVFLLKKTIY